MARQTSTPIVNYNGAHDTIDLSTLLGSTGANESNIGNYVQLTEDSNNNVLIQVDTTGQHNFSNVATTEVASIHSFASNDAVNILFQQAQQHVQMQPSH